MSGAERVCAYPGCGRAISAESLAGVCRAHNHHAIVDEAPMSRLQIAAVAITVGLNALDGFDVLSISFAAPGIAAEWGDGPALHAHQIVLEVASETGGIGLLL